MPFNIDDKELLEKYKAIWTKIEDFNALMHIELNALPVYDNRYIKTNEEHNLINFILTFMA